MKKPITFGGITAGQGEKINGNTPILDTGYVMPTTVINGAFEGPTVLITSGVHGGEYPGIQTAIELSRDIDPAGVHGQIVIIHPVNTQAFITRTQYVVPQDGKNINRVFPGKKDGTLAEQTAYVVSEEFQKRADYHLDLHGGDLHEQLPTYVYYPNVENQEVIEKSLKMAEMIEANYLVKTTNWGGAVGAAGYYHNLPAVLIELGGRGLWSREEVDTYKKNIHNVLKALEVEEGTPVKPDKKAITLYGDFNPMASADGCWYPCVNLGDEVKAGQKVGELRDLFGDVIDEIFTEVDGLVIYMVVSLAVNKGAPLISIGVNKPQ